MIQTSMSVVACGGVGGADVGSGVGAGGGALGHQVPLQLMQSCAEIEQEFVLGAGLVHLALPLKHVDGIGHQQHIAPPGVGAGGGAGGGVLLFTHVHPPPPHRPFPEPPLQRSGSLFFEMELPSKPSSSSNWPSGSPRHRSRVPPNQLERTTVKLVSPSG